MHAANIRSNKANVLQLHNRALNSVDRKNKKSKSNKRLTQIITNCIRQMMVRVLKLIRSNADALKKIATAVVAMMLLAFMTSYFVDQLQAPIVIVSDTTENNDNQSLSSSKSSNIQSNVTSVELKAGIMREKIWSKLKQLQEPEDCDTVEYLSCSTPDTCGFGCSLAKVLQCLAHGHKEDRTVILANEKLFGGNSWSKYMLPISKCQDYYHENTQKILSMDSTIAFSTGTDDWENHRDWVPDYTKEFLHKGNMIYPTGWFLGIMNGYLFREFQPNVEKYIQRRITDIFGKDKTKDDIHFDISCHIRRTDKVSYGEALRFELREYVNEIDHAIIMKSKNRNFHGSYGKKYGLDVYLATDAPSIINEAKTKYGQYTWYYNEIGAGTANKKLTAGRLNDQNTFYNTIFDLLMLSKSDYFVGTLSSNYGRVAVQLMANKYIDPSQYVLSLDEEYYAPV